MLSLEINPLLEHVLAFSEDASDLNFSVGRPPQVEINGVLTPVPTRGMSRLTPYQAEVLALHILKGNRELISRLIRTGAVDLSYSIPGKCRFRVNIFQQRGTYAIVMRVIPTGVPSLSTLGLPEELYKVPELRNGLVLVTGPTGSGKSTTLAAVIKEINQTQAYHIVTIEDPIEYLHSHVLSTINQREIGSDTVNFATALRAALRQAPKVILVGEMRDVETISTGMEAAETGHLVLSTLHTIDASKTVDRIIGVFPREDEPSIRQRFAQTFRYVVSQRLAPRADVDGRIAVLEILKSTMRTRDYIVKGEGEGRSLVDAMREGELDGMACFDEQLQRLVRARIITKATAFSFATNPHNLALEMNDIPDISNEMELAAVGAPSDGDSTTDGGSADGGRPDWIE